MGFLLTIPARINILGNPSDGNEGDFATISTAVELHAYAWLEPARTYEVMTIDSTNLSGGKKHATSGPKSLNHPITHLPLKVTHYLEFLPKDLPIPLTGELDLIKGAINRLHQFSSEFRNKMNCQGVRIVVWSDVPRQSGLGGSSLFVLLTLAGLRTFYQLDSRLHNDYVLAELTQRVEGSDLKIACGFADRYVPLFGGLAYLDYRGKLFHNDLYDEPFVTYERLDSWVADLPLLAITTGIKHDSGDVHGRMRPRYLEEYSRWEKENGAIPPMVQFMKAAWETAWRGKIALLLEDWKTFGALMNQNHVLVNDMMSYCGFQDGAGWANNLFIETALKNGALGAKLTGAGGGGSVFALTEPGEEDKLKESWLTAAREHQLDEAVIFRPRISRTGLTVEEVNG